VLNTAALESASGWVKTRAHRPAPAFGTRLRIGRLQHLRLTAKCRAARFLGNPGSDFAAGPYDPKGVSTLGACHLVSYVLSERLSDDFRAG
jgi:hypothetical protein